MVSKSFLISFVYRLDQAKIDVNLQAEIEIQKDDTCYIVRNIRSLNNGNTSAIPEIRLTKKASIWVHVDSQKPTDLTLCIGQAIDMLELHQNKQS